MKPFPLLTRLGPVALLLTAGLPLTAAHTAGGTAYTKRLETKLLAAPSALAPPAAKLSLGRPLKIEEVRGPWLRVSDGPVTGWVFAGNVSENKPASGKGLDGLGLAASQTTATAAARPLTPVAMEYAARNNLENARTDFDWLLAQCQAFTPEEVEAFMKEKQKGEYQ